MDYGKKLKELREEKNISRYRLSKITGIPESTLKNWEIGFEPTVTKYIKALGGLGLEVRIVEKEKEVEE